MDRHYMQDGDMDSRWSCGPLAEWSGSRFADGCDIDFSLNYYRYVRQIQLGKDPGCGSVVTVSAWCLQ